MTSALDQMKLWATERQIKRLDLANGSFGATEWEAYKPPARSEPYGFGQSSIHGGYVEQDEEQRLCYGHLQDPETKALRMGPRLFYPGIVLMPWLENPIIPGPSRSLWVQLRYTLGTTVFHYKSKDGASTSTGWNGTILSAKAKLFWADFNDDFHKDNVIFPGDRQHTMPPGNEFVWHACLGITDEQGNYCEVEKHGLRWVCGQYCIPF